MSCTKCQQKKPCTTTNNCACEVYLTSDCINNVKAEFECLNISNGLSLTETLEAMDEQICVKLDTVTNYFTLINLGTGEEIYKGVNNLGQKEFKTLVKTGNLITINSDDNTVIIGLDEEALNTFIEANQKLTVVSNAGTTGETLVKTEVVTGDTTTYPIKRLSHSAQDGGGESVVRDLQVNTDDLTLRTKKLNSSTLTITSTDEEVLIDLVETSDIPRFIVNSAYTGTEELGTLNKPYKSIESAKIAYIGTGDAQEPQFKDGEIIIQKGNGYTHTGDLVLNTGTGSIIIEEGTFINANTTGDWLCDFDTLSETESAFFRIIIKEGAVLQLNKNGFRNKGTSVDNSAFTDSKAIFLSGSGQIYQATNDNSTISYTILESNFVTTDTFKNDSFEVFNIKGVKLNALTQQIYKVGGNSITIFDSVEFISNSTNLSIKVLNQIGGSIRNNNYTFNFLNSNLTTIFSLSKNVDIPCFLSLVDGIVNTNCVNLFQNETSLQATVNVKNLKTQFGTITNIAKSPNVMWIGFGIYNSIIDTGVVDQTQVDLTAGNTISTTNIFNSKVVESLQVFGSRALAVAGGLQKGNAFINRKTITAGSFVLDEEYQISVLGTGVNWTSIGASSATIGINFIYNGVTVTGTGGEAYSHRRDILI